MLTDHMTPDQRIRAAWRVYDAHEDDPTIQRGALRIIAKTMMETRLRDEAVELQDAPSVQRYALLIQSWQGLGTGFRVARQRARLAEDVGEMIRLRCYPEAAKALGIAVDADPDIE